VFLCRVLQHHFARLEKTKNVVAYIHRHCAFGESGKPGNGARCRVWFSRCVGLGSQTCRASLIETSQNRRESVAILLSVVGRRPRIVSSDIERQPHGFAEGQFVIFENLRTRKMSHHFLIGRSGCASCAHYTCAAVRLTTPADRTTAHSKMRTLLSDRCPDGVAVRRRCRRESAVEDQGTGSCPRRANAEKAHCVVLKFYVARGKGRCFA